MIWQAIVGFFKAVGGFYVKYKAYIDAALTLATIYTGVKNYRQAQDMLAEGQNILANKTSAGGKLPVIYGTRRVGAQIIYMDVSDNDSRDLYVVYALSVGELEEIMLKTVELDGVSLYDGNRFRDGGYLGSDRSSIDNNYNPLNTVSQNGLGIDAGAGSFGSNPALRYRYVLNAHHGAATQTADPMLVASMPNWTSAHKLNGVAYIAAHYGFDAEGIWSGIPQLTVQVRGKKVYDPRDNTQTFGTPSTYKYSGNPALCFLEYITNNEYGKGLTASQINMSTFSTAATVCETYRTQPYFNDVAQDITWSADADDNQFTVGGSDANEKWWQNKIGEILSIYDANGDLVIDETEITDVRRNEFYDENKEFVVIIDDSFDEDETDVAGSWLLKIKRFQCNAYIDCNKTVMENAKNLLSNMRGIFTYIDGKYELQVEDTGTSTFSITEDHIISESGIAVDYGNKDKKANKVVVEFFNANKKYELDTATVLHDATPEYYSDDNDEILELKVEFPYISDPYIAYNMGKAILVRSRNQMTIQFLGTPEMYKLNIGDIVDVTYAGLGLSGKVCRVEALELQANGLVAVSLIEYFDIYTWEVPPQEPIEQLINKPSAYAVKSPRNIIFTDTDASAINRPTLTWDNPTDFPVKEFRANITDSSSNAVISKVIDTNSVDLSFIPKGSNYNYSLTSINTLGVESEATTGTFTIADDPVKTTEVEMNGVTMSTVETYGTVSGKTGNFVNFTNKVNFEEVAEFEDGLVVDGGSVSFADPVTFADGFTGQGIFDIDQGAIEFGSGTFTPTPTTNRLYRSGDNLIWSGSELGRVSNGTPASATATGTTGEIQWDANYIYVCVATNTWKRVAISTW